MGDHTLGYRMRAVRRENGEIQTRRLVRLKNPLIEPTSVQQAEQFVKEWGDYNEFWEYTLVNPETITQKRFYFCDQLEEI